VLMRFFQQKEGSGLILGKEKPATATKPAGFSE